MSPMGTPRTPRSRRGIGKRATSEATRDGQGVVVAAHSTGEGGEPRPTGPTGGKATPGITTSGGTYGRDAGLTNRIQETPENCPAGPGLSGHGVQLCVSLDRPGVLAGSLSPDPE